jgi:tagatose 6-phosphate kinase
VIVAAGLSPAWQQVLVTEQFQPGAVNRASSAYWCASGKVINVGVALHYLSAGRSDASLTLSTLGGPAYDAIETELGALGVSRRWVRTQTPTRICTTIVDRATATTTELVENAGRISATELTQFESAFAESALNAQVVILTGSLPAGAPPDFFRRLLGHVRTLAVLDIRGPELVAALDARPFVVKPNRQELSHTLGRPLHSHEDVQDAIAELQRRGAQSVVVTAGDDAIWLGTDGKISKIQPPTVDRIVNPIGCGDCMTAGIAWALDRGLDVATAVQEGMHAAARNIRTLLPSDFDGERERLGLH